MPKKYEATKFSQCAFIPLHDLGILNGVKIPNGVTDLTLWYKKNDNFWGLTAKAFENQSDVIINQFALKISWTYKEYTDSLVPTAASRDYTEEITGDLLEKLKNIKEKHQLKANNKTTKAILKDANKKAKRTKDDNVSTNSDKNDILLD